MTRITFPKGFLWGVASSAYQVEGSPLADGAGPSIWHEFARRRGKIKDATNGDTACDHYHRYKEDIGIMREMGVQAYRFSIAWPRVFPERGSFNSAGLDFYSRLVDALLAAGIEPCATLFHWETPVWVERGGGFVERSSVDRLMEYATAVFGRLGDRVKNWMTINEPSIYSFFGYILGEYPPGRRASFRRALHCAHHLLLAHARLAEALPARVPGARIGLVHHCVWVDPRDPRNRKDREAAAFMDETLNGLFVDPFFGGYPERMLGRLGRFLPRRHEEDLSFMKGKIGDFIGVNYYTRNVYRHARFQPFTRAREAIDPSMPRSSMWEIHPQGIYKTLLRLRDRYGNLPCMVTENGFPLREKPGRDPLEDKERISYLADHLCMVGKAVGEGVDCRGYFHWSLMDNWEWDKGFQERFGLIRTDFSTQARAWKSSAFWYRDVIKENAVETAELPRIDAPPAGGTPYGA
jgi:beta-glucosidase